MIPNYKNRQIRDRLCSDVADRLGIPTIDGQAWTLDECMSILNQFPLEFLKEEHDAILHNGERIGDFTDEWYKAVETIFIEKSLKLSDKL